MLLFLKKLYSKSVISKVRFVKQCGMATTQKKPFTVVIEGNIGSGKSTFLNNFINNQNILTLYEPVKDWKNLDGHDLMKLFYNDISSWAFSFQTYVLLTMMRAHEMKTDRPIKMMERSIYSGRYVFIENLSRLNVLSKPELSVLDEWFKWLTNKGSSLVDLIVYLRVNPEIAHKRIKQRARPGEELISIEYIKQLHQCYEDWLIKKHHFDCNVPVICLNANDDVETVVNSYKHYENQMKPQMKLY